MGPLNWSRMLLASSFSTALLLLWMSVFRWLGSVFGIPSLFGIYIFMFSGWFLAVAIPLNWYFLTERRWITDGMLLGGFVTVGFWISNIITELVRDVVYGNIDFSIFQGSSLGIIWNVDEFLQSIAILMVIGALVGWLVQTFGPLSASTFMKE